MDKMPSWYILLVGLLAFTALVSLMSSREFTGFVTGANITTANVTITATVIGSAPSVTNVNVDANIGLVANGYQTVFCNVTAQDTNGGSDIVAFNATLFESSAGHIGSDDNNSRFINGSCDMNAASGNVRTANCTFKVWYYANNGPWGCMAYANDTTSNIGNDSTTSTMGTCVGIVIGPASSMSFGAINPGSSSGNNSLNVSNRCNTQIDLLTQGINMTSGANTILIRNVSYSFSPWNVATFLNVTHVGDNVPPAGDFNTSFDLAKQTTGTHSNRSMWFNLSVPLGQPAGSYIGALNFTVQVG